MSENVLDELEPIITPIRHALIGVGLPLRIRGSRDGTGLSSKYRLIRMDNMAAADAVIILRAAVKQVCRRMGLLASFMTKPAPPECVFERLASASVAVSHGDRQKCLR